MKWTVFVAVCILGTVLGEIAIDKLPIPSIDDLVIIKERCDNKGGEGTYEKVKEAKEKLQTCITDMFNATQIKIELDVAAETGSMDEVFGKYCRKRPEVKTCLVSFTDVIKPCLEETEKDALNLTLNILEQLGEFACYRDGDRMAMFIAEGGIECLKDHTEGIQNCVNSTFNLQHAQMPTDTNSLPNLFIDREKCNDLGRLQTCVVEELEKCEESTPANVVDALFKFVKKQACKTNLRKRSIFKRSAVTDSFDSDSLKLKFLEQMKKRCTKYGTDNSYANLETSYTESFACLQRLRGGSGMPMNEVRETIKGCLETSAKDIQACLPEEEQYMGDFYINITLSIVDYTFEIKEKLQTTGFSREMMECFTAYKQNPENLNQIKDCLYEDYDNMDMDKIWPKDKLCEQLETTKTCVNQSIAKVCIRDIEIQNVVEGFMDALSTPCAKE